MNCARSAMPLPYLHKTLALRVLAVGSLVALGFFLVRMPLAFGALLIIGGWGAVLLLQRPTRGLYVLAIAIPFGSEWAFHLGGITVNGTQVALGAFIAAWALYALSHRDLDVGHTRLALATGFLLGAMGLSLLQTQALGPALAELLKWVEFLILLVYVGGRVSWEERRGLLAALLLGGLGQGILGIYQFLFRIGPEGFLLWGRYMRAHGTFDQPNPYGGYLGLTLPLAYGYLFTHLGVWRKKATAQISVSVERGLWLLAAAAAVVMAMGLVMSWSRGALLGLAAGIALVTLAMVKRWWPTLLIMGILLLSTAPWWQPLLPTSYGTRLADTTTYLGQDLRLVEITDDNFAIIERLAHWQAAWQMFSRSPWLGVGIGQYAVVYPSVALPRWQDPLGHAHNYYLHILAETGLVGLGAYILLALSMLGLAWRGTRNPAPWPRALAVGALGLIGHLLAHSLVDNLYVHDMYLLIAMVLGMLVPPLANEQQARSHSPIGNEAL